MNPTDRATEKKITRVIGDEFCTLEVRLQPTVNADGVAVMRGARLSICGSSGMVMTLKRAREYTIDFWESYFSEGDEGILAMHKLGCRTARGAAKKVLASDGLVGDMTEVSKGVVHYVTSAGQIRDEILRFFPEVEPYLKWHLNDMHAECEHQEARGETYQKNPDAVCHECCGDGCELKAHTSDIGGRILAETAYGATAWRQPKCGYHIGSAWTTRELPATVIGWFDSLGREVERKKAV